MKILNRPVARPYSRFIILPKAGSSTLAVNALRTGGRRVANVKALPVLECGVRIKNVSAGGSLLCGSRGSFHFETMALSSLCKEMTVVKTDTIDKE